MGSAASQMFRSTRKNPGLPTPRIVMEPPPHVVRLRQAGLFILLAGLLGVAFALGRFSAQREMAGGEAARAAQPQAAAPAFPEAGRPVVAEAAKPDTPSASPAAADPPAPVAGKSLKIEHFTLLPKGDGGYRYRLAVANQGEAFRGALQFEVKALAAGEEVVRTLPEAASPLERKVQLEVRRYLRTEGDLPLPPSWQPVRVEIRLVQQGAVRASQVWPGNEGRK